MYDWQADSAAWAYGHLQPSYKALFKSYVEDFRVSEVMGFEPSGDGEHVWLWIEKTHAHTDRVSKDIARLANVAYRDVSYSGMKDVFGITRQWFSVGLANKSEPDWLQLNNDNVNVITVNRNSKKLRSGTHKSNQFEIVLRNIEPQKNNKTSTLLETQSAVTSRWLEIIKQGAPNYFGPQRFGRDANNLNQAIEMFNGKAVKNRSLRGILLSSARSWLFNHCLSNRVNSGSWLNLYLGEPALLDGSESFFNATGEKGEQQRIESVDIHPSTLLWGNVKPGSTEKYFQLHADELAWCSDYPELQSGLEQTGLKAIRRANRCLPRGAEFKWVNSDLHLKFNLQKGQFATSVLRELVRV